MKRIIATVALALCAICLYGQQRTVVGRVVDEATAEPLAGVAVVAPSSSHAVVTGKDGMFSLPVGRRTESVTFACLGFEQKSVAVPLSDDVGTVELRQETFLLKDAMVVGQVALPRKTPLAVSSVSSTVLNEKLGNQELVEILKQTPGVHVNRQGGGWADSEIYMRGFDNSNIAVMINGIPVNPEKYLPKK